MATHVRCPLCGKSSSLRAFPAHGSVDLALHSFRGLGRGRGFAVLPGGSGLDDERLTRSVHEKVVGILRTLESRGYGLPVQRASHESRDSSRDHERLATLELELAHEKSSRELAETDIAGLSKELAKERQSRDRALTHVAILSHQLDEARRMQDQLLASSRDTIVSLRQLRGQLQGIPFAAISLAPVIHDVKQMVELVQELRALSLVKSEGLREPSTTR